MQMHITQKGLYTASSTTVSGVAVSSRAANQGAKETIAPTPNQPKIAIRAIFPPPKTIRVR
jgi:hypothetical protein